MKIKSVFSSAILTAVLCISGNVLAVCPSGDLTGDCQVNLADFAKMAEQWLTDGIQEIVWVSISDPGVSGHEVFVGEMSKYETTNAQYCEFLNAALAAGQITVHTDNVVYATIDTSHSQPYFDTYAASSYSQISYSGGVFSVRTREGYSMDNHPVVMVSWDGATAFCNYYGYRLPSEWEWQAAADYDGSYTYGCGTTINHSKANYYEGGYANPLGLTGYPYTSLVGYYPAYGYGMCDMAGNVIEWTSTISGSNRVLRGGSWTDDASNCSMTFVGYDTPTDRSSNIGFRVCRSAAPILNGMIWVDINDPGIGGGHEGFTGEMAQYETTNAQYCQFLNAALASGDITVSGDYVCGASGSNSGTDFVGQYYYDLAGPGFTYNGATNGGAARINYTGTSFTVDSGFENHPVTYVSWHGATAFASYYDCRLPTEWEWQAVADYDGSFTYGCGTSINNSIANYFNSVHPDGTTVVGAYGTYGYGMCDMAGNVLELMSHCFFPDCSRDWIAARGGAWGALDYNLEVSSQGFVNDVTVMGNNVGFRVCR